MGSGSSQPKPQQTQSAPATARSTPKPRRNQQFQEVQVTQAGGNPKPRGTPRGGQGQTAQAGQVAGQGASPKPHQSTSNPATRPAGQRGQDPGASGSSTDRSSRPQQQQRGAAANPRGGQRQTAMAGQQQPPSMSFDELMKSAKDEGPPRMSYEELKKTSKTSKDPTNPSNDIAQKDERNARTDEVVAANGSSGANNSSNVAAQMGNDMEKSQKGVPAKAHVTGKAGNAPGKKKPSLIVVKPSKPTAETTDKLKQVGKDKKGTDGDRKDSKVATDRAKHDDTTEGKQGSKTGPILQRSKIFRSGLKDIKEENEEEKSGQTKLAQNKTGTSQVKQTMQRKPVVKGFGQAGSKSNADANKTESAESKSKANDNKTETNTNKTENKAHPGSEKGKNRIGGSIDKENQSEKIGLEKSNGVDTHNEQSNDIDKVKKAGKQTDGSSIKPGSKGAGSVKDKGATNSDEHYSETGQSKQASHNQIPKGIADISDKPESSVKTQDTKVNSGEINSGKSNKSVSKVNQGDKAEINGASNSFGKNIGNSNNKDDKNKSRSTNKPTDMNKSEVGTNKTANEHQEPTDSKSNKLTNGTVSSSSTQNMGKVDGLHENNQTKSQLENENKNMKNEITDAKATTSNDDEKLNQNEITTTKTNTQNKDDDYDKGKSKAKKKVVDEQGFINYEILDKVTDQIQKIQEETETGENLSQLSYDNFYDGKEEDIGTAADLSHEPKAEDAEESEAAGASKADNGDPEVLSMKEDDIVFETFYHRSGKEFQCIYQSGMRFYLDDWGSKEWQPFPKRWYNEGLLVTNTILREDGTEQARGADQSGAGASGQGGSGQGQSRSQGRSQGQGGSGGSDDREGFIMHPTRGRVPTYIFYKKHNVHMYFDKETGSWVRLPIGWELHHDMVKSLVDQVEEAVPTWGDRHDILALLRACNYDPDECISIYLHLEKDEWMKVARTAKEAKGMDDKENKIAELEKKNRELEIELQKERQRREELERNLDDQTNKMSEIEAESKQTEAQMSAMTGGRPKSARPISVMRMAGKGGKPGAKGGRPPTKQGEVVNPDDVLDLNANAKELRKAHVKLKAEVERYFGDFKHIVGQVGPAIKKLKQSEKGTQNEIEEVRALYRKEALQRKLLYNQLQELRGNIRVFCRVRKDDKADPCLKFPSDQDIQCIHPQQGKKMFNFDKIFDPTSTQEAVFDDTKPIITSCADGYNVCLLAYGQTGSGKTFTMMGPESNPGINIRAMKELFKVCSERKETMTYKLTVSLVEIYNETLQDLLTSDAKALDLRTAGNKVVIPGLTEHEIKTVDDVKKIMSMGDKNRSVASTKMNSTSSRSHLVLMLAVEGNDKVTNAVTRGTLVLCDLAGSERISKTEAEGQRLVEAAAINKSLSALGQVFTALRTSQLHVPYRNSKLTQILQPSLGGDAKACLFVNVSPDTYNYLETVSTLTFGSNARQVALGQAKQNISKGK